MLDEVKDTWQLSKMWDLEADPGIETKEKVRKTLVEFELGLYLKSY